MMCCHNRLCTQNLAIMIKYDFRQPLVSACCFFFGTYVEEALGFSGSVPDICTELDTLKRCTWLTHVLFNWYMYIFIGCGWMDWSGCCRDIADHFEPTRVHSGHYVIWPAKPRNHGSGYIISINMIYVNIAWGVTWRCWRARAMCFCPSFLLHG